MPCAVAGCVIIGLALIVDGDTLHIGPDKIRLHAINENGGAIIPH